MKTLLRQDDELRELESGRIKQQTKLDVDESVPMDLEIAQSDSDYKNPTRGEATKQDNGINDDKPENSSCIPKRVRDMYTTSDWWTLWVGLISFALAVTLVFAVPFFNSGKDKRARVVPQPMTWRDNPLDAWDIFDAFGTFYLLTVLMAVYMLALKFMGKISVEKPAPMYARGFAGISTVAVISFWLGRQEWCARNGFGYAIFAIIFGMLLANVPISCNGDRLPDRIPSLKLVAKDGEFFIKSSLVLLAVEFSVLSMVGWQAIIIAWIGSPVALVSGYVIGTRLFKMDAGVTLLVAVGSTWCGASAISAVAAIIGSPSADISLSISVVAFFTVVFTFAQAYFAIGVGMPDDVAGAWIGGSVDQTGNVIASAAIISERATEIAGIVKIVLNSGLGIIATMIACWWQTRQDNNAENKNFSILIIWDKFPKFVLGYLLCSAILTVALPKLDEKMEGDGDALRSAVLTMNKWWFAIAFVGIGIGTSIKDLWDGALKSGVLKLYLVTNMLDIFIALGLAYTVF